MNELQKRFAKKQLTPQQKRVIVEATEQSVKRWTPVSFVGPSFLILLTTFILLTFGGGRSKETTTAATSEMILSENYFLNLCNIVLMVGILVYMLKLAKEGRWKLPARWIGLLERTRIFWIVVLLVGYLSVDTVIGMHSYYKEIVFMMLLMILVTLYVFFPTDVMTGRGIVFKKRVFIVSFIFIICSYMINWTIDPLNKINANAAAFSFPTSVNWEPYFIGQLGVVLFVVGTIAFIRSLEKYRVLAFVLIFFFINAVPGSVMFVKQTFFAKDAAAIHYLEDGRCQYETNMSGNVDFYCELTLENRSSESATFMIEIFEPFERDGVSVQTFNEAGPFTYTFNPKEQRTIMIDDYIQIGNSLQQQQLGGGEVMIHVKIFDNETISYQ